MAVPIENNGKGKPTKPQLAVLVRLSNGNDAAWDTRAERNCIDRGWVERCDTTKVLGPDVSFTTYRERLTKEGWEIIHAMRRAV